MINFNEGGLDCQSVFHWKQNRWEFTQMVCLDSGLDFTRLPGGLEMINSREMEPFMAKCR